MADLKELLYNLEKELTCPICEEIFTNPRTLKCLHTFCGTCIFDWCEACKRERRPLTCPVCKSVEDNDVSKLTSSFIVNSLLQAFMRITGVDKQSQTQPHCVSCRKETKLVAFCLRCQGLICDKCMNDHKTLTGTPVDQHQVMMFSEFKKGIIKNQMCCQERYHDNNPLDFYCTTCQQFICSICGNTNHKSPIHDTVTLEVAAEKAKMFLKRDMDRVNTVKENYERELGLSRQNMVRIDKEITSAIKEVRNEVEKHIKVLREHETAVVENLQRKLLQQKTHNDEEQREIRDVIESISEFNLQGQTLLDENVEHFIIKSEQERSLRCEAFLHKPPILSSKPTERNTSVRYTPNPQITQMLQDIGTVVENVIDPSRCSIENVNDIWCTFEVVTRSSQNVVCVTNKGSVDVQIQDGDGINVEKEVSQSDTGKYTVTYRSDKPSDYTIHVRINGQEIKNLPQTVKRRDIRGEFEPLLTFGYEGSKIGELCYPRSLAISARGEVAIADYDNHRIVLFTVDGEYLRHFGQKGTGDGEFCNPFSVLFNEDDRLIVTDNINDDTGRLQEFDLNGTYGRTIYKQKGVLRGSCNADENIAVCFEDENRKTGVKSISKQVGQPVLEFFCVDKDEVPLDIAYGNGKYFISCIVKHYITVYDRNGFLLYKFGEEGSGHGQFSHPRGLAAITDLIVVCDANNHRVQMLTQDGQFISSFGRHGSGLGEMNLPVDVAVAPDGKILVLEMDNHRVQKTATTKERGTNQDKRSSLSSDADTESKSQENQEFDSATNEALENATKETRNFIRTVNHFKDKRRATVNSLRDLAYNLNELSEKFDLIVIASAASNGQEQRIKDKHDETEGSEMIKMRIVKTLSILDEDMKTMRQVDEMYSNLSYDSDTLSRLNPCLGSNGQILTSLLLSDMVSNTQVKPGTSFKAATAVFGMLYTGAMRTSVDEAARSTSAEHFQKKVSSCLLPKINEIFGGGVVTTAKDVMNATSSINVPSQDYNVGTLLCLEDKSKSEKAKMLEDIAEGYERQMQQIEDVLALLSSFAEELEGNLKQNFRILLESISKKAEFTAINSLKRVPPKEVKRNTVEYSRRKNEKTNSKPAIESEDDDIMKASKKAQRLIEELNIGVKKRNSMLFILVEIANELEMLSEHIDLVAAQKDQVGDLAEERADADAVELSVFNAKIREAQKTLDADKESMSTIEDLYGNLVQDAEVISCSSPDLGRKEQILTSLLVVNAFSQSATKGDGSIESASIVYRMLYSDKSVSGKTDELRERLMEKIVSRCTPLMLKLFDHGLISSYQNVVDSSVFKSAAQQQSPAELSYDIHALVVTLVSLNKGSKSEAARTIRDIVQKCDEQGTRMSEFLQLLSDLAEDLESLIKMKFRNLLESISTKNKVEGTDVQEFLKFIFTICTKAWKDAFNSKISCSETFAIQVSRIFTYLRPKFEEYEAQYRQYRNDNVLDLTFLAHGMIREPLLPCTLNYMNEHVAFVILYVPWGCLLDARAALGIATKTIICNDENYTGQVCPDFPRRWNVFPGDFTPIPEVVFTPVMTNESVYQALVSISNRIGANFPGLVIPYFQEPGMPQLPQVELWALSVSVAVTSYIQNLTTTIHVASCLAPSHLTPFDGNLLLTDSIYPPNVTVSCSQYCAAPVTPGNLITMTMEIRDAFNNIITDEDLQQHINTINAALMELGP